MKTINKLKSIAIAKLKNGELPSEISEELDVSISLIKEWEDELNPNELVAKEVNAIAISKATEILQANRKHNTEQLQNTLLELALTITDELKMGIHDFEIAKSINVSADTIAKLQGAFFAKGAQIAVVNSNVEESDSKLQKFKGLLRK